MPQKEILYSFGLWLSVDWCNVHQEASGLHQWYQIVSESDAYRGSGKFAESAINIGEWNDEMVENRYLQKTSYEIRYDLNRPLLLR